MKECVSSSAIGWSRLDLVQLERDFEVELNTGQLARLSDQVCVVAQRLAVGFVLHCFPTCKGCFNRTELLDDLYCPLGANTRSSRNVVDRVPHQTKQINKLVCGNSKLVFYPRLVTPLNWRNWFFPFDDLRVLPHADDIRIAHKLAHVFVV